jgi:hypothetical protein
MKDEGRGMRDEAREKKERVRPPLLSTVHFLAPASLISRPLPLAPIHDPAAELAGMGEGRAALRLKTPFGFGTSFLRTSIGIGTTSRQPAEMAGMRLPLP